MAIVAVTYSDSDTDADNTTASVTSSAGGTFTEYAFVNEEAGTSDLVSYLFYSTNVADGAETLSVTHSTTVTAELIAAYSFTGLHTSNPWRGIVVTNTAHGLTSISIAVLSAVEDPVIDPVIGTGLGAGDAPGVGAETKRRCIASWRGGQFL